jgi:hypothetical protein
MRVDLDGLLDRGPVGGAGGAPEPDYGPTFDNQGLDFQ